jgi:hypothetical protein
VSADVQPAPALDARPPRTTPPGRATLFGRSLHALALGVAIGGFVGMVAFPRGLYVVAFVVGFVLWLLLTLVRTFAAVATAMPSRSAAPALPSQLALARVESIRRTGLEINDQPQCDLTLVVGPRDGSGQAYATTTRAILDVVTLASFQPGAVVVVARPDPALPDVTLVPHPPADLAAAARAEARLEPGEGALPALDRVLIRESTRTPTTGFRAPTAGSLLTGLVLTVAGGVAVLLPTLLG